MTKKRKAIFARRWGPLGASDASKIDHFLDLIFEAKNERLLTANLRARDALSELSSASWRLRGSPQGSKNVTLRCKINDFDENDVETKNDDFSHSWAPCDLPVTPQGPKTAPCDFAKSNPGRASVATGPPKTSFYHGFLMFFVVGSKINENLRKNENPVNFNDLLFRCSVKKHSKNKVSKMRSKMRPPGWSKP